ncbi:CpsD/CapB family tyrosine-protein kinase [Priestia megaterium]|uniref:CpsD/CapB family tyrosine-protein kinase n=1 Tax=Priestia megaterium TaxID=1404 RepID=UPI003132DEEC
MKVLSRKFKSKNQSYVNLIAYNNPASPITEQYRLVRTNIEFSSVDKEIKSIVVTSPAPADGKSTTASNLAIVLAQQGKKVLLIDADLRKPSIHYIFRTENTKGLTSVLTNRFGIETAITKTGISNLSILTSGPIPPNPAELLNSESMRSIMQDLKNKFDYLIFDTPPTLSVTDSQVLSNKCDGIVIVISSGKTTIEEAKNTKKLLSNTGAHLLGVVLNGAELKKENYNYL